MLSVSSIYAAQTKYGVNEAISDTEIVTYDMYLAGCRRAFTERTPHAYYDWDRKRQNDFTDNLIVNYVRNNKKAVEGYVDNNGDLKQDELINRLRIDIVDFGILRFALEDDSIQEIQINDFKTIFVVRDGWSE